MADKERPPQKAFIMQFQLPMDSVVTVTGVDQALTRTNARVNPVDVEKRYPKEASVDPDLVADYIQKRKDLGPEHTETDIAMSRLTGGIKEAKQRGFDFDRVINDFEDTLAETRQNYEGRRMGSEPMRVKPVRNEIETAALEEWYPDEPAHEEPA